MYNSAKALLKGIKAEFSQMMQTAAATSFEKLISRVKSNSDNEVYWLPETIPGFKEWQDERHFGDFSDKKLTVINRDWDSGLRVEANTINDSREYLGGNVESWVKMLVDQYKSFPDRLCQTLLDNNSNAFDGTAFFATSRPYLDNTNTINNLVSGTSSTTYSLTEFEADYVSAKKLLLGMFDKNNQPFNANVKLAAVVPYHLEDVAKTLLSDRQNLVYISGTKSNLYALDGVEIIINWNQTSSSDNDWYLVNINSPFKPFVIQDRTSPDWKVWDHEGLTKYIDYGVDFRMGYNFLNPFAMVKVNN